MESVAVPKKILRRGKLPMVCVMTGEPDATLRSVWLTGSLAWQYVLVAIFPPLLLLAKRQRAQLPMSRASYRRMMRAKWLTVPSLMVLHVVGAMSLLLSGNLRVMAVGYPLLLILLWQFYLRFHVLTVPTMSTFGDHVVRIRIPSTVAADQIRAAAEGWKLPGAVAAELAEARGDDWEE